MKINEIAKSIRTSYNTYPTGTWANATWDIIASMLQGTYDNRIYLPDYWSIGDTRTVHIDEIPANDSCYAQAHPAQDIKLTILDFNHDQLATPIGSHWRSVLTIGMTNTLAETYNVSNATLPDSTQVITTNDIHWKDSIYQSWCSNDFFNALPSGLTNLVKTVTHPNMNMYYDLYLSQRGYVRNDIRKTLDSITEEKCWFYDYTELFDNDEYKTQDNHCPLRYKYFIDNDYDYIQVGDTTADTRLDKLFFRSYQYYYFFNVDSWYGRYDYHLGARENNKLNQYISVAMAL